MANAPKNVTEGTEAEWETAVEPFAPTWNFDENATCQGIYLGSREVEQEDLNNPGQSRMTTVYEVEDGTGEKWSIWETWALAEAFKKIPTGNMVRIAYEGKAPTSKPGQTVRRFSVQHRKP